MAKKRIPKKIEKTIHNYIIGLRKDKLPINKVILFGSFAKGNQHEWSDIDLCVVSPKFKDFFDTLQYLFSKREYTPGHHIEPMGFNLRDFNSKDSALVQEIKKHGIEIKIK